MKKLRTPTLMFIGAGCLLLLGAAMIASLLVTVTVVALTVLLSVIVHELLGRKIDDELISREPIIGLGDQQNDGDETQAPAYQKSRKSLRLVDRWFRPRGEVVEHSRLELPALPSVPVEHQQMVQEYLQAGLALGLALNETVPGHGLAVHPGTFRRFERIEAEFARYYRTFSPVQFRQLAASSTESIAGAKLIERLAEGESSYQYAAHIRSTFFPSLRKAS